jgi:cyclic dehypoxanthinyl futalosine synthase
MSLTITQNLSYLQIQGHIQQNQRLSREQAIWLWQNATDDQLMQLASIVRARYHKPDEATYLLMRIINYTNICVAKCDYCSFYRLPMDKDGYVRSKEWIFAKIEELVAMGGELFAFNGGFNPQLKIDFYLDLFSSIRNRYGDALEFYAMTVVELIYIARLSKLSFPQALSLFKEAGVRWITGGGAEILADSFRLRHSPLKYTVAEYMNAQAEILAAGIKTTATMVIGFDETLEERLDHLDTIRQFQDQFVNSVGAKKRVGARSIATSPSNEPTHETSGIFSFLCWTYKPYNNELGGQEVNANEYLRHLALSRIYLDNFKHIRASVLTQNANALRGLKFGANDFDIPWEDEVTEMAGAVIERDVERILGYARAEGFNPIPRHIAPKLLNQK